jgi:hypothetical protein
VAALFKGRFDGMAVIQTKKAGKDSFIHFKNTLANLTN